MVYFGIYLFGLVAMVISIAEDTNINAHSFKWSNVLWIIGWPITITAALFRKILD